MPLEVKMIPFAAFLNLCLLASWANLLDEMLSVGKQKSRDYAACKPFFLFYFSLEL